MDSGNIHPVLIDQQADLDALAERLMSASGFGVDTEADSLYRYQPRVCLVQITLGDDDYVVDPLAVDIRPLGPAFSSPSVQKVMHAGEQDVMSLRQEYGFEFRNLFDTMLTARALKLPHLGLAALLAEYFSVRSDKRLQRANWGARPLTERQLNYAATDSHYLISLRDLLQPKAQQAGLTHSLQDAFASLEQAEWHAKGFDPDGYLHLPGAHAMDGTQRAILRQLYLWREDVARARDVPPFRIARPDLLSRLATMQPRTHQALMLMMGNQDGALIEHGDAILRCISQGRSAPEPPAPEPRQRPGRRRYRRLATWRDETAQKLGVPSEELLSADTLNRLVSLQPQSLEDLAMVRGLDPAITAQYGESLLQAANGAGD